MQELFVAVLSIISLCPHAGILTLLRLNHMSSKVQIKWFCPLFYRGVHLHSDFEISSLKNLVRRTGFFVYFELDFYCLRSLQKSSSK